MTNAEMIYELRKSISLIEEMLLIVDRLPLETEESYDRCCEIISHTTKTLSLIEKEIKEPYITKLSFEIGEEIKNLLSRKKD